MTDDEIIGAALGILQERAKYGPPLTSPQATKDYLKLTLGGLEHEEFWAVWLNTQHQVIEVDRLFNGTLTQTSVYPREVVRRALAVNAGAVIFAHNHPSGTADPSGADGLITQTLKQALALVDVRVLDHFIIANVNLTSMAERGMI